MTADSPQYDGFSAWLGFYDEQRNLLDVLAFEHRDTLEAGQSVGPLRPLSGGTPPSGARFYRLAYWRRAGIGGPRKTVTVALSEPAIPSGVHDTAEFAMAFKVIPDYIGFVLSNKTQSMMRVIWMSALSLTRTGTLTGCCMWEFAS
jgi:hypothetical protein